MIEIFVVWLGDPHGADSRLETKGQVVSFCRRLVEYADSLRAVRTFDASLRFAATLHYYVLTKDPRVASLAPFYPTVGGTQSPSSESFEAALLRALDGLGDLLFERARTWRVQTNETSRGLAWLLPAALLGVDAAHLLEFGASAGLNLYGEQRGYRIEREDGSQLLHVGRGKDDEFIVALDGECPPLPIEGSLSGPEILSRFGGDIESIDLDDPDIEQRLAACIWGDQPDRLEHLRAGIAIHKKARAGGGVHPAVRLLDVQLPDDLDTFLRRATPQKASAPVISYNTYVTAYLNDVDQRALQRIVREFARKWSLQHKLPWMWVRFEPARPGEPKEPRRGWCRWRVELFEGASHEVVELGWAHPHFQQLRLGAGVARLLELGANG